jgi:hypothetical protein
MPNALILLLALPHNFAPPLRIQQWIVKWVVKWGHQHSAVAAVVVATSSSSSITSSTSTALILDIYLRMLDHPCFARCTFALAASLAALEYEYNIVSTV